MLSLYKTNERANKTTTEPKDIYAYRIICIMFEEVFADDGIKDLETNFVMLRLDFAHLEFYRE